MTKNNDPNDNIQNKDDQISIGKLTRFQSAMTMQSNKDSDYYPNKSERDIKRDTFRDHDGSVSGNVNKNSKRIINNLKNVMSDLKKQREMGVSTGRDASSKKLYKSNKLFDQDKSKQKRFD